MAGDASCVLERLGENVAAAGAPFELSQLFERSGGNDLTVGRLAPNDMDLHALEVPAAVEGQRLNISRNHATLSLVCEPWHSPMLKITNLGSHGTYVNDTKLRKEKPQRLREGDVIGFAGKSVIAGRAELKVRAATAVLHVPPPPSIFWGICRQQRLRAECHAACNLRLLGRPADWSRE